MKQANKQTRSQRRWSRVLGSRYSYTIKVRNGQYLEMQRKRKPDVAEPVSTKRKPSSQEPAVWQMSF